MYATSVDIAEIYMIRENTWTPVYTFKSYERMFTHYAEI